MIGLFFLSSDADGKRSCIPQGALMIVLLIITIAFQVYIDWVWKPAKLNASLLSDSPVGSKKGMANGKEGLLNDGNVPEAEAESDEDKYGFLPPSMWRQQPTVWITDDVHGLGRIETARAKAGGVDASCDGAHMDEQGRFKPVDRTIDMC